MPWRPRTNMDKIQTSLESSLQSVDKAEELALQEAAKLGFDDDEQHQIGMAVRECTVNAVVHGNRYNKNKKIHQILIDPVIVLPLLSVTRARDSI